MKPRTPRAAKAKPAAARDFFQRAHRKAVNARRLNKKGLGGACVLYGDYQRPRLTTRWLTGPAIDRPRGWRIRGWQISVAERFFR